ncbi:MAG TPA: hypothetical protein VGI45_15015 [Terracidiphilus sp.]|jgi:hypothetical protein
MPAENGVPAMMMPNGPGGAAVLAAGIGSFALGLISFTADKVGTLAKLLNIYHPTGPLSGVSTLSILMWLVAWVLLGYRWRRKNVDLRRVVAGSLVLLAVGILLTFPPFADLL